MTPPLTLKEIRAFVAAHNWRTASTMPEAPHQYTLRKHAADEAEFERVVLAIRELGYPARWGGREYIYLDVDGFQYWTMGAPLRDTILINRAQKPGAPASP